MICHYCDLCLVPFKNNDMYMLRVSPPITEEDIKAYNNNDSNYWNKIKKEVKEICPDCKALFDKIFELRRNNLCKLANQLKDQFNLTPKIVQQKKRKNGKKSND